MKLEDIAPYTFKKMLPAIHAKMAEDASHHLILQPSGDLCLYFDRLSDSTDIVSRHYSANSLFCRAVVSMNYLTLEQMNRAAMRYRLGMARDGGVIFWQIGLQNQVYDGKIMYYRENCHRDHDHLPTWVSSELKSFYLANASEFADKIKTTHCLFGTHLLSQSQCSDKLSSRLSKGPIAVVEAEKTAIIMSELYPEYLWLAAGGMNELTATKLFPLKGKKIILFPDTDEDGRAYETWYRIMLEAQKLLSQSIFLSPLLELNATPDQKRRKIDLVDYYFETIKPQLYD